MTLSPSSFLPMLLHHLQFSPSIDSGSLSRFLTFGARRRFTDAEDERSLHRNAFSWTEPEADKKGFRLVIGRSYVVPTSMGDLSKLV